MKQLLLVSDGLFHPPLPGRVTLRRFLTGLPGCALTVTRSLEKLPPGLERFDAMLLYFHHKQVTPAALHALDQFVGAGGGLLAIHSATASFKSTPHYFELLGGRFTGHGKVAPFQIVPSGESPLFAGLPAFWLTDEVYLHETQAGIQVHFTTRHAGQDVPVVWTWTYGRGRVCYAMPGHRSATLADPHYQQVLQRGLEWVWRS
ncbi:MAG: ThuA domain-containing protein [Chloroflexi bacterium]|nr:ThuA domain-containing protein [Anaerolineaceae bacterium]NMB90759.1 ThuA domain-containing protein [Chloroflexota bacterium]